MAEAAARAAALLANPRRRSFTCETSSNVVICNVGCNCRVFELLDADPGRQAPPDFTPRLSVSVCGLLAPAVVCYMHARHFVLGSNRRRLCILKGIYPRVPPKLPSRAASNQTFYHVKDIGFLAHEPVMHKFREMKSFMKKVRKAAGKGQLTEARKLAAGRPVYRIDHLVSMLTPIAATLGG